MKKIVTTALIVLSTSTLFAEEPKNFNMATKVSTLGFGVDVSRPLNDKVSARFNLNGFLYSDTQKKDGNDFKGTLNLLTAGVLVDYFPFENNFRWSAGAYYNGNGFKGNVKPSATTTVNIGGTEYAVGDIGSLDADLSFNKLAPYVGLGWGNNAHDEGWGFTFDLGVMYHGEGKATLTPKDVSVIDKDLLDRNVAQEEQNINNDLSDFPFYPVVALGVNYSF